MPKIGTFAFTTNEVTIAVRNTLDLANRVQASMTKDTPPKERARLAAIITALTNVRKAANQINCPNPFYGFYTVDVDKLAAAGATPSKSKAKAGKKKK